MQLSGLIRTALILLGGGCVVTLAAFFAFVEKQSVWTHIGGEDRPSGWTVGKHDRVRAIEAYEDSLYVGLGYNGAELYRTKDSSSWENVTGPWISKDKTKSEYVKQPYSEVASPVQYNGALYVGLGSRGAQLWRYDDTGWFFVGGWRKASSVYELEVFDGRLFAGFHQGWEKGAAGGNRLVSWDGSELREEKVPWNSDVNWIYSMVSSDDALYVSTVSEPKRSDRIADIWKMSKVQGAYVWQRIGGRGLNNSWSIESPHIATSMVWHDGALVVGLNCQACSTFMHVWRFAEDSWSKVGESLKCTDEPEIAPLQRSFNALASVNGKLVAAGGAAGRAEAFTVWQYDGKWECINTVDRISKKAWDKNQYGYSLKALGSKIYLGTLGRADLFEIAVDP